MLDISESLNARVSQPRVNALVNKVSKPLLRALTCYKTIICTLCRLELAYVGYLRVFERSGKPAQGKCSSKQSKQAFAQGVDLLQDYQIFCHAESATLETCMTVFAMPCLVKNV